MNLKTTLALLVLAAAGGALAWFGPSLPQAINPVSPPPVVADAGSRAALAGLAPEKLTRIAIRSGDRVTILERTAGGAWTLPGGWPVRTAEVNALVELLGNLRSRFEPEQPRVGMYAVTVELTTTDGQHTLGFYEEPAADDGNRFTRPTYVHVDAIPEVLRLAPGLLTVLDRPADFYQQRRLFPVERVARENDAAQKMQRLVAAGLTVDEGPSIAELAAAGPGLAAQPVHPAHHFRLARVGESWELSAPVRDRLDPAPRDTLLAAVPDIWAERFIGTDPADVGAAFAGSEGGLAGAAVTLAWASVTSSGKSPAWLRVKSGLETPERTLTVRRADGRESTLLIGKPSGVRISKKPGRPAPGMPPGMPPPEETVREEFHYAQLKDNPQVFEIRADKLKDIFVDAAVLRDSRVARFNTADARRVEIDQAGRRTVLVKDKERWKLAEPIQADADAGKVDELLNKLTGLDARKDDIRDILTPDMPVERQAAALKSVGLDQPAATVKVTVEEEVKGGADAKAKKTRTVTVALGKKDEAAKKVHVRTDAWPRVDAVDESLVPLVTRPALSYRGNRVFDFAAADIAGLEVDEAGKKIVLKQTPDQWKLAAPVSADADKEKADQLASGLANLEVIEYVGDSPTEKELASDYGLVKPGLAVTLTFKDKPPRTLQIGKMRNGKPGYFAKLADGPGVFALNNDVVNLLKRDSLAYLPSKLWQAAADEVAGLRIRRAGHDDYRVTRSGSGWKVSGPFEAAALPEAVQAILAQAASPPVERYASHDAKDTAKFGLDKPTLVLGVTTKDGKEHTLTVGNPVEKDAKSRYARLGAGPAVCVIGEPLFVAADKSALDLLDPVLVQLDPSRVNRVQCRDDNAALTLERKGDAWQVTAGPGAPFAADEQTMTALLAPWLSLKAEHYAAYGPKAELAKYGLDKPAFAISVQEPAGEHSVELGKAVEGVAGARYARVDKGPGVAILGPDATKALAQQPLDFVNRTLLKFDPRSVTAIQRQGGGDLGLVRHDVSWKIVKPADEPADDKTLNDLVDSLAGLRAVRIAAYPAKDLAQYGLDSAAPTVTLQLAGKPDRHVVRLGRLVPGSEGERFATVDGGTAVAVLPGEVARKLAAGPLAFRNKDLVRFPDADRLRLERGSRRALFARVDGSWKLTEPLAGEADQDELDDFLNRLARLRADEFVQEKPTATDLARYGLDKPVARWHALNGDKEVLHLAIGNREKAGTRHFARIADRDVVFLLDSKLSDKALGEFRTRTVWTPPLDAAQVESLRYGYKNAPFVLEKSEAGAWQVVGKPDLAVNSATVTETLAALSGLKLVRYAADKDANLPLFGLEPPELVLEVATRAGKRTLQIGHAVGESKRRYARVAEPGRSDVFILGAADVAKIVRDPAGFTRPPLTPPKPGT
jgi:hypothetical protein